MKAEQTQLGGTQAPARTGANDGSSRANALAALQTRYVSDDSRTYLRTHERRYETLLREVAELVERTREEQPATRVRILDVGAAYEAEAIRALMPDVIVDSLGFFDERFPPREQERHVAFDLNDAEFADHWPELGEYDGIVLAEVVEHLYTSPVHLFRLLARALRPGGWLLVQTPNAAALKNRVELLRGRNPFEPLRESRYWAGHVREYTVDELLALGREAGLEPTRWFTANYFDTGSRKNRVLVTLERFIPSGLRAGTTACFRKPIRSSPDRSVNDAAD